MGLVETATDLAKLIQKLDNIELNEKILQLQKDAHDLIDERAELKSRARKLTDELEELRRLQKIDEEELFFRDNCLWMEQKRGGPELEWPHCSKCWDADRNLMRMHRLGNRAYAECPNCKTRVVAWPDDDEPESMTVPLERG